MSKSFREDLTGKRFGRLTVIEFVPTDARRSYWKCTCDCGNINTVAEDKLKNGHTKSCGCLAKDHISNFCRISIKHNLTNTRLFRIWDGMKDRCYNPNYSHYKDYGGRGIIICDEWKNDFIPFYNWSINNGYDDTLSLDRIDVNGNYCPENCRWITHKEQQRNKQNTVFVEYQGERLCLAEIAEKTDINYQTLYGRYLRGDRGEKLFRPVKK